MNEKVFNGDVNKLRSPERRQRLQVERVVNYCLAGLEIKSVLDIGTGTGLFAEEFSNRSLVVKGIDCNEQFLEIAQQHAPNAKFRKAVAENLPFDSGSYDLVFMGHVLHEADDPLKAMQEAVRVMRKRVAILEWPYVEQEMGPPLDHRMPEKTVRKLGEDAGLGLCDVIQMQVMQLYIFEK
ncbi:MAG: hypothetical protein PWR01_2742 [Clostridiales bacterium]|nr:hypothetical protein [Clostridiales bacterium]MDN5281669.1 hypothetical protein [Candidatus Ozemobacter sp.]